MIENNPPYGAEVKFVDCSSLDGWFAERLNNDLKSIIHKASRNFYQNDAFSFGEGASIPFLKILGDRVIFFFNLNVFCFFWDVLNDFSNVNKKIPI